MFHNRREAGRRLAERLRALGPWRDPLVVGLPRGGVPVARPIADVVDADLDVFLVRKLGVPGYPELAMGAIALGGVRVLNEQVLEMLGIPPSVVEMVAERETEELQRRALFYRGTVEAPRVADRSVIVVDDGIATGATMQAAVRALKIEGAAQVVVAAPVAAPEAVRELRKTADQVVVELVPPDFMAVGRWYEDFTQVADEEVRMLLARKRGNGAARPRPEDAAVR